ncbi:MAG: adenosylcobalamin-dependent ribonucleoside-diphosphate reductase [Hyphomicrobiaceae bacterium]
MSTSKSSQPQFLAPISREIWTRKYRFSGSTEQAGDTTLDDTFWRVARAAASVERGGKRAQEKWARTFYNSFSDFGFLPAGRILAGAGTGRNVTLFNCFVLGRIQDDLADIFDNVKQAALTMQAGGGIGHDFSTLRPKGALVKSIGADASGPVSFMDVWDAMCRTIMSAGQRRGAMMATLRCDHPDIEDFIAAKSDPARLRNFNLSVLVTDAFMAAVRDDTPWDLVFAGKVYKTVSARGLWEKLMRATYDYAEPGVIFIDRVNAQNNLSYCETIAATNPCGEQPLPPYGACLLGSINLAALVRDPFTGGATLDMTLLQEQVTSAVRFLDNVIDISLYPLKAQAEEARAKRRIGLGITGLADALIFVGLRYGSQEARDMASRWMAAIQNAAYKASAMLAAEKGAFPLYDAAAFLASPNVARLDPQVRALIVEHGIRNGCLTSIAPTGTISLLAGNVSSGIEPVFDFAYRRRVMHDTARVEETVEDFAHARFRALNPDATLPDVFVRAGDLSPAEHLAMQAALQPFVDSAISKTINCPQDMTFEEFRDVYTQAYAQGLKGCTTYRPNAITGAVLVAGEATAASAPVPATSAVSVSPVAAHSVSGDTSSGRSRDPALSSGAGDVVYLSKPLERDEALEGVTYKIKWPASPHALYVTINDIVRDGRRRPFEIFINTKNLEHYAWTVALTRMISAVFRRGGDVSFVAEELKAVFDPEGGRWMGGRYVPSLLAAIGDVIEEHMIRIGFLVPEGAVGSEPQPHAARALAAGHPAASDASDRPNNKTDATAGAPAQISPSAHSGADIHARICPRCGVRSLQRIEGCWTCTSCHYSHCG